MPKSPQPLGGRPSGVAADGPSLSRIRKEHGVTMAELARGIGRDYKTIWRAERGLPISEVTAYQIARALTRIGPRVRPQDFMAEWPDDEETPEEVLAS